MSTKRIDTLGDLLRHSAATGFAIVPRLPTERMLDFGFDRLVGFDHEKESAKGAAHGVWMMMVVAAEGKL